MSVNVTADAKRELCLVRQRQRPRVGRRVV